MIFYWRFPTKHSTKTFKLYVLVTLDKRLQGFILVNLIKFMNTYFKLLWIHLGTLLPLYIFFVYNINLTYTLNKLQFPLQLYTIY